MVKKTIKKVKSVKPNIKKQDVSYNYNKEFSELDAALRNTKLIKFQQIMYSVVIFILFLPLFFNKDVSLTYYVSAVILSMVMLLLSVYIAQSNRILVLLAQIKYFLEKNKK